VSECVGLGFLEPFEMYEVDLSFTLQVAGYLAPVILYYVADYVSQPRNIAVGLFKYGMNHILKVVNTRRTH
jgi:hypothetical protein